MALTDESRAFWQKALRKLGEATGTSAESFPGSVVNSSYYAMRNAAIAVILATGAPAPSAETAIIAAFGAAVAKAGYAGAAEDGAALNRLFDLQTAEVYDHQFAPSVSEANAARDHAKTLLTNCGAHFGYSTDAAPGAPAP